jgi:hypothetical protein
MNRAVLGAGILAAVLIICTPAATRAESIGAPGVTLEQGVASIDLEGSYYERRLEMTEFEYGSFIKRNNELMRSHRLYLKLSYGIYNDPSDGFLKGAEAFARIGGASAEIRDMFASEESFTTADRFFNADFNGAYRLAVGGGAKATLYRLGDLNVGVTYQLTYFDNRDEDGWIYNNGTDYDIRMKKDIDFVEQDAALGASYDIDTGALGILRPYLGVVHSWVDGDVDWQWDIMEVGIPVVSLSLSGGHDLDEDSGLGAFIGADWAFTDFAHVGAEFDFYGDGQGAAVYGGIRF